MTGPSSDARAAAIALASARATLITSNPRTDLFAATLALLVHAHATLSPAPPDTASPDTAPIPLARRILADLPSTPDIPADIAHDFIALLASTIPPRARANALPRTFPHARAFTLAIALERTYEALLSLDAATSGSTRARLGAVYTPASLAHRLTRDAWKRLIHARGPTAAPLLHASLHTPQTQPLHILDPSCGSGRFLLAALRVAHASNAPLPILHGVDIDPCAVFLTRLLLITHPRATQPADACARIHLADALALPLPTASFDLVLGNPPFLNQLERASARNAHASRALSLSTQGIIKGYADTASAFLHRAITLTRPGGVTCMIQPLSILAARDARPLRAWSSRTATLESLWVGDTHAFAASVYACALTLRRARAPITSSTTSINLTPQSAHHTITLSRGLPPKRIARIRATRTTRWSVLASRACGVPTLALPPDLPTLATWLQATADFRDVYYALRDIIIDAPATAATGSTASPASASTPTPTLIPIPALIPILNTGLIELATTTWGLTPARLFRARWSRPAFDLSRAQQHPSLTRILPLRLQPKIILATQTRIIEAFVDETGTWMPTTPLISLTPRPSAPDLFTIAAALCAPVATLVAARRTFGTSLTPRAIKLAARQALDLPIPSDPSRLSTAAAALRAASLTRVHTPDYDAAIRTFAHHATAAYDLTPADHDRVLAWWHDRRSARRPNPDLGTAPQ